MLICVYYNYIRAFRQINSYAKCDNRFGHHSCIKDTNVYDNIHVSFVTSAGVESSDNYCDQDVGAKPLISLTTKYTNDQHGTHILLTKS